MTAAQRRALISAAIVAAAILALAIAWAVTTRGDDPSQRADAATPTGVRSGGVEYPAGDLVDNEQAPLVEVYSDFLCPHCKDFADQSGRYLEEAATAGEIRLRWVPYVVLDRTEGAEEYSSRAANLVLCANEEQGAAAAWTVHDALFANLPTAAPLPDAQALIDLAAEAGVTGLDECVESNRFQEWVQHRYDTIGSEGRVTSTPTVVIDGQVTEARTRADLQTAIDAAAG